VAVVFQHLFRHDIVFDSLGIVAHVDALVELCWEIENEFQTLCVFNEKRKVSNERNREGGND
jgi:hypothetical protein